jgi:glycosyltransferase involved in cell wall biosynthesis
MTVDARMVESGGIGTYIAELLPRVIASMPATRFTVLGRESALRPLIAASERVSIRRFVAPIYSLREQSAFVRVIPRDTTLFWAPHFNVPLAYRGCLAVTVHDVNHIAYAQASLPGRAYARFMLERVRRRASVVFCVSECTATEFRRHIGPPRELIVSHLGVAPHWFEPGEPSPTAAPPFFLYVGNVKPHKNLVGLIEAFARVAGDIPHRLVIVGRREGMRTVDHRVGRAAAALGDRVLFTGHLPQAALGALVKQCDALVLPSLCEGFGLPPLEALACGRAIAVSDVASLPEVCGPLAEYFDPRSVDSIAAALVRLARRPPDTDAIIARRRAWARRFCWETSTATTTAGLVRAACPHRVSG